MNKQTISIIIPAYNEERYLARCLESIALLTYQPHEVIVVDNNSSDGTAVVAKRYGFVKLLREPRQGRVFAQSTGFDTATGTILARIDADAVLPANWTARIAEHFAHPGALQTAWTGGALFYNVRFPRAVSMLYGFVGFTLNRLLTGYPSLWGSSMAFTKQAWGQVGHDLCQEANQHEDLDLSIHLHRAGYKIVHDRRTNVRAELRPAYAGPRQVWDYILMWPRTLARHRIWTWRFAWLICLPIFVCMPYFGISERVARLFGRKSLGQ